MSYRRHNMMASIKEYAVTRKNNPEVMAIVYAQGWAASPKHMTFEEAAAVTDIGTAFKPISAATRITHFDEFQYFTGVTSIGEYAFGNNTVPVLYLSSITLPPSIKTIGNFAFRQCHLGGELRIPPSVTSINRTAFQDVVSYDGTWNGRPTLIIDNDNVLVNYNGWIYNAKFKNIIQGEHCVRTPLYDCCFYTSDYKTLIVAIQGVLVPSIHSSCTKIGKYAFEYSDASVISSADGLTVPSGITNIEQFAFSDANLTGELNLNNVTTLGNNAFANCKKITGHLDLRNITSLDSLVFRYVAASSVDFGSSISNISQAMVGDTNLKTVIFRRGSVVSAHSAMVTRLKNNNATIYVPDNLVDTYKNDTGDQYGNRNWITIANQIKPLSEYVE